jgi:hypothetical protein
MRKLLLVVLIVFSFNIAFAEMQVEHNYKDFSEGEQIKISVIITHDSGSNAFDVAEMVPYGWQIQDWSIRNNNSAVPFETAAQEYLGKTYNMNHWIFNKESSHEILLDYTVSGKQAGNYGFVSIWTCLNSFGSEDFTVNVKEKQSTNSNRITGFAVNTLPEGVEPVEQAVPAVVEPKTQKMNLAGFFSAYLRDLGLLSN